MTAAGEVSADDVDELVLGAGVLAAGATPAWSAVAPVRAAVARGGAVPLIAAAALPRAALVVAVGVTDGAGWPADEAWRAVIKAAEDRAGIPCVAVLPVAAGGTGAPAAVHAASVAGLPCVDGDGAGRDGRIDLTLFGLSGLAAMPILADCDGVDTALFHTADNILAQRLVDASASVLTGPVAFGAYPMTSTDCARLATPGAVLACLRIAAATRSDRFGAGIQSLFTGVVTHVAKDDRPGAGNGTATIEWRSAGRTLRLDFQRGYLIAAEDGLPCATVPDLICVLDAESGLPVPTADLLPGRAVHVLAVAADHRWHRPDGIAAAGPRRFGYDIDPVLPTGPTLDQEHVA